MDKPVVGAIYYCHNCHESISFGNFLKRIDSDLAEQYKRDKFLDKNTPEEEQHPLSKIYRKSLYRRFYVVIAR